MRITMTMMLRPTMANPMKNVKTVNIEGSYEYEEGDSFEYDK